MASRSAPPAPIEAGTVAGAIAELERRGFRSWFRAVDGGLQDLETGQILAPEGMVIRAYYRFEGVSDPGDMAIVYAIESRDGRLRGTLTDAFGVYADPATGAALRALA